jgi:hypothetical protein
MLANTLYFTLDLYFFNIFCLYSYSLRTSFALRVLAEVRLLFFLSTYIILKEYSTTVTGHTRVNPD